MTKKQEISPLVDRHEHVRRITAAWQNTVHNIIETGRLLIEAKDDIGHGGFQEMIRTELPFGPNTAQRLIQIAENPVLSNAAHVPLLPASWGTLYELAKLPKHGVDLEVLIEERAIHPKLERKDVRAFLPSRKPEQRDDDLPPDYEGSSDPAPDDGATEPDRPVTNPLIVMWANASRKERHEFVCTCWAEITRARDQGATLNGGGGADHWADLSKENAEQLDRWIEGDNL
jgi:Protein of unknown function (DUF3102)